ncbi:MAG: phosphoribosylglycinamide formyltransferase [Candidatus Wenzhouxiangella sp. M2_3B_020]
MSGDGLVLLISGRGSNALAIIDAVARGIVPAPVNAVIADRPAEGLRLAAERGIDTAMLSRQFHASRESFEHALAETIDGYRPRLIALAGFMRVLSAGFVHRYAGRMVNIHPSLLPKYRGLDTHRRALDAGDAEHGASVHWVTPELDAGPVVARAHVPVHPDDTPEVLAERVLEQEHRLYPAALALLLADPVTDSHEKPFPDNPLVLDRDLRADGRRGPGG